MAADLLDVTCVLATNLPPHAPPRVYLTLFPGADLSAPLLEMPQTDTLLPAPPTGDAAPDTARFTLPTLSGGSATLHVAVECIDPASGNVVAGGAVLVRVGAAEMQQLAGGKAEVWCGVDGLGVTDAGVALLVEHWPGGANAPAAATDYSPPAHDAYYGYPATGHVDVPTAYPVDAGVIACSDRSLEPTPRGKYGPSPASAATHALLAPVRMAQAAVSSAVHAPAHAVQGAKNALLAPFRAAAHAPANAANAVHHAATMPFHQANAAVHMVGQAPANAVHAAKWAALAPVHHAHGQAYAKTSRIRRIRNAVRELKHAVTMR